MELVFEDGGEMLFNYASVMDDNINILLMGRLASTSGTGIVGDAVERAMVTGNIIMECPDELDKIVFESTIEYIIVSTFNTHNDTAYAITVDDIMTDDILDIVNQFGIDDIDYEAMQSVIDKYGDVLHSYAGVTRNDDGDAIEYAGLLGWEDNGSLTLKLGYFKEESSFIGLFPMHSPEDMDEKFEPSYSDTSIVMPLEIPAVPTSFMANISQSLICSMVIEYIITIDADRDSVINNIKIQSQFIPDPINEEFINTLSNRDWVEHLVVAESIVRNNRNIEAFIGYNDSTGTLFCVLD